ncbi:MAG: GNAT family N-acetyltransferase [Clostridiales bacterium]|nr:GNAT family N-acetyltransferase [Clostridiales bacterium]
MRFTQYPTAAAFMDDVLSVLQIHEIQNNLIYRNIGDGNIMLTVKDDDGRVLLVAARTPPHPMVLYERDNLHSEEVAAFFAKSLPEHGIDVDFLMTNSELAQSLVRHYGTTAGKEFVNNQRLVLSVTDRAVKPRRMACGKLRLATEDDMHFLPYWCADFSVACNIGAYNLQNGLESARRLVADEQLYIWENGTPVSMAASHRKVTGCRFVGYVYTPPQLRGNGYASACVYSLTDRLLTKKHPRCALYIDCANPISNGIYEKIGYEPTGYVEQYREVPVKL